MSNMPNPLTTMVSFRVPVTYKWAMKNAAKDLGISVPGVLTRCLLGSFDITKYLDNPSKEDIKEMAELVKRNREKLEQRK